MKNISIKLFSLLLPGIMLFAFNSCEEDNDQWIYDGPALASFPQETTANFLVEDIADPTYNITLGINNVVGSDQTIEVRVVEELSTAVLGVHFNLDTLITVPANQVLTELPVSVIFSSLPNAPVTVVLEIEGQNAAEYDNQFVLNLIKFIPFDIVNFSGTFECTEVSFFGEFVYDVTLTPVEGTQNVLISGFGGGMEAAYGLPRGAMNPLEVTFNTPSPSAYSTSMEEIVAFTMEGVDSYYEASTGSLNTLTNEFTLDGFAIYDAEGAWDIIESASFKKK